MEIRITGEGANASATFGYCIESLSSSWWQGYRIGLGVAQFSRFQPPDEIIAKISEYLRTH